MIDFARARRTMVDNQLRTSAITDWRILDAMNRVPRERFVPESHAAFAYVDDAIPLSAHRTLAAPAAFARLVQLAGIGSQDSVLDVGCGTGYTAAVLGHLASAVVGLEDDEALAAQANDTLSDLGLDTVVAVSGPIEAGAPRHAPFDAIILEGAVDAVPEALFAQLGDGGRLVAVLGTGNAAVAHLYVKTGKDVAATASFNVSLPLLGKFAPAPGFVF